MKVLVDTKKSWNHPVRCGSCLSHLVIEAADLRLKPFKYDNSCWYVGFRCPVCEKERYFALVDHTGGQTIPRHLMEPLITTYRELHPPPPTRWRPFAKWWDEFWNSDSGGLGEM